MNKICLAIGAVMLLSSCHSQRNVLYLQDNVIDQSEVIENAKNIRIQPRDQISIMVSCKEPQLAVIFNLLQTSQRLGSSGGTKGGSSSSSSGNTSAYTVDSQGNIDFPVLGELHVGGMTRKEVSTMIKDRLVREDLVKDPIVTVEFINLHFTAIGDISSPGQYAIGNDQINLFEAIAMAGDLNITGKRDAVYVIREEDGHRITHKVDLRSADVFDSPVYYLQQNDIIYVEPNGMKAGQSTVNENSWKSVSMWMSITSFLLSIGVLIFK